MFTAYWNNDRKITVDFSQGNNDPTIVEDVLPPELRGDQVSKEAFENFWQGLFIMWLVSKQFSEDSRKGTKDNPAQLKWTDYVDYRELGIWDAEGHVDHDQLRGMIKIIAPRWQDKPRIGLIHNLLQQGFDLKDIEASLAKMTIPFTNKIDKNLAQLQPNTYERQLVEIMLPPECRGKNAQPVTKEQGLLWMKWCRRLPLDHPDFIKPENWHSDLKKLEILNITGDLDKGRAEIISHYIWSHRDDEPNFDQLLQWLKSQDKNKSKTQKMHMDNLKRKKKLERKQRKLGRKRGN